MEVTLTNKRSVPVIYYYTTNHPQIYWVRTAVTYFTDKSAICRGLDGDSWFLLHMVSAR